MFMYTSSLAQSPNILLRCGGVLQAERAIFHNELQPAAVADRRKSHRAAMFSELSSSQHRYADFKGLSINMFLPVCHSGSCSPLNEAYNTHYLLRPPSQSRPIIGAWTCVDGNLPKNPLSGRPSFSSLWRTSPTQIRLPVFAPLPGVRVADLTFD